MMHDGQVFLNEALVGRLVGTQFPELAGLARRTVEQVVMDFGS
jgi:hypothetical protein